MYINCLTLLPFLKCEAGSEMVIIMAVFLWHPTTNYSVGASNWCKHMQAPFIDDGGTTVIMKSA